MLSQTLLSTGLRRRGRTIERFKRVATGPWGLIALGALAVCGVLAFDLQQGAHLRTPRLALLGQSRFVLKLHVATALAALAIGTALLLGVKGHSLHRAAGWVWAACMITVAVSSFWLRDDGGKFSYIHLLSGWVSIAVPMALAAARRHDVKHHRATMTRVFTLGLVVAGALTLLPGRLMWRVFFG